MENRTNGKSRPFVLVGARVYIPGAEEVILGTDSKANLGGSCCGQDESVKESGCCVTTPKAEVTASCCGSAQTNEETSSCCG